MIIRMGEGQIRVGDGRAGTPDGARYHVGRLAQYNHKLLPQRPLLLTALSAILMVLMAIVFVEAFRKWYELLHEPHVTKKPERVPGLAVGK